MNKAILLSVPLFTAILWGSAAAQQSAATNQIRAKEHECDHELGIPVKVNGDSSGKPNGVPVKANSGRSEATLAG